MTIEFNKKGMDTTQILIYVVSIAVLGFILLFGFRALTTFVDSERDIVQAQFQTDFTSLVQRVSTDHGRVDFFSIRFPSHFDQICFINVHENPPDDCDTLLSALICDEWRDYIQDTSDSTIQKRNIFFRNTDGTVGDTYSVEGIIIESQTHENHFFCATRQQNEIRLEGQRRQVLLRLMS